MNTPAPIRRVLLALDAAGLDAEAFEAASALAARLGAELEALFVEDDDLARLAALPFARQLGLSSATRRPLLHGDIERAWRAGAVRARTALSQAAARHQVRWSFQVRRGETGAVLVQLAAQSDLITVTLGGPAVTRTTVVESVLRAAPCPLLVRPAGGALRAPYVVLDEGSEASARALRLTLQLARDGGGDIVVLLAAGEHARREQLRAQAEAIAVSAGVRIATRALAPSDAIAVAGAIRALRPGTLVLAADSALVDAALLRRLPAAVGCPSLLVR
jgi:nucleotide-binding universal stress UspA family protein